MRNRIGIVLVLATVLAGCGDGGPDASTTSAPPPSTTSTTSANTTTTVEATTTTTIAATTTTVQAIDVYFEGGQVVGEDVFSFNVGDEVSIWFLSDTDEEVHVHGYDVSFAAKAGTPLEITLVADVPGIFEVELEATHTLLFELEVTP
jgi:hypothetical protein